ncbi:MULTISPECIES: helix-turn-helix domain-containing protein [unclassified Pseudoalteromonas]|uniref:helix-turn-helix domain-containing protein n=1 Tax=unclassified Pseudoalteromonas TaxID=194690 RepID=UPI003867CC22
MIPNAQPIALDGFQKASVSPVLSSFIDSYWCIKSTEYAPKTTHFLHSDCASGIIFNFQQPLTINDSRLDSDGYICTTFFQSQKLNLTKNIDALGVRFKPAATKLFTDFQAKDIRDLITTDVCTFSTNYMYDQLANHDSFCAQVHFLNGFFTAHLHTKTINIAQQHISQSLLGIVSKMCGNLTLGDLSTKTGLHTKKIERLFAEYIGMNFRQCSQIIKAKLAMQAIKTQPNLPLAELALTLNYFDQAHFTNQFKKIIGVTPANYRQIKHKTA